MINKLKNFKKETINRIKSETSSYFKPFQKLGAGMTIVGLGLKITGIIFPATLPIALLDIAPQIIGIGLTMFTNSSLTKQK